MSILVKLEQQFLVADVVEELLLVKNLPSSQVLVDEMKRHQIDGVDGLGFVVVEALDKVGMKAWM